VKEGMFMQILCISNLFIGYFMIGVKFMDLIELESLDFEGVWYVLLLEDRLGAEYN